MRALFLIFITFFSLNASMLLDKKNCCIEDYYISNGRFYYLKSRTGNWNSTTYANYSNSILYGYDYNSTDDTCKPKGIVKDLGIDYLTFNSLLALSGLLFSSIMVFILASFLVGA